MCRRTGAAIVAALVALTVPMPARVNVSVLETPAADGSGMYSLAEGANRDIYLSWIETSAEGVSSLRFSQLAGNDWSPPREIARGSDWFVNWADRPSLTALDERTLLAHWLVKTGRRQGAYGYGIRVARSTDEGRSWNTIFEDGMRNVSDYSGFLTFAPGPGGADAIFLTPASPDEGGGEHGAHGQQEPVKTLATVWFGVAGPPARQQTVDPDVCSCCATDVARTSDGVVAVYRDHEPGEIRDISIARLVDGRWQAPQPVHRDGWKIAGCPTNGPAVATDGRTVVVVWFTAANDQPRVKFAFSSDGGATFGSPIVVDDGKPVGWPDVELLEDGSAVVSWLESRGGGSGEVLLRRVTPGQTLTTPLAVAPAASGRATGEPQLARAGNRLIVAWRAGRVRTAAVPIEALR